MKTPPIESIRAAISLFLAEYPLDATSWGQATDELPDMAKALQKDLPVRHSLSTPAEWNSTYRQIIENRVKKLDDLSLIGFFHRFEQWLARHIPEAKKIEVKFTCNQVAIQYYAREEGVEKWTLVTQIKWKPGVSFDTVCDLEVGKLIDKGFNPTKVIRERS